MVANLIRWTVPTPQPTIRAVFRMPVPAARLARTAASSVSATLGRPISLPWARALARPALVRSTHGPSRDHIDFAPSDCLAQSIETGSGLTAFGAADAVVAEGRDHVPAV